MKRKLTCISLAAVAAAVLAVGCGPAVLRDQHSVKFSTGGQIVYALDGSEGLAGVAITLTGPDGTQYTASSGSDGLWTISKLPPGVYAAHYELTGYEPVDTELALDAFGPNQVSNPFVSAGTVQMDETLLRADIGPFAVQVKPGDSPRDGIGSSVLVYSISGDGAITVTFPRRVYNGQVRLTDEQTFQQINAQLDTATGTTFTFSKNEIDNINGGQNPLTSDNDPYTWHRISIQNVQTYSPIHGDPQTISAEAWFNATP